MPLSNRRTLTQYLIEQRRRFPGASGELNALILDVSIACKAIARSVAFGALGDPSTRDIVAAKPGGDTNVQGEVQKPLDIVSNEFFVRTTEWSGNLAGQASEEMDTVRQIPAGFQRGKYLLVFDPLDGSSNIDVNVSVGSIFSILRLPNHAARRVVDLGALARQHIGRTATFVRVWAHLRGAVLAVVDQVKARELAEVEGVVDAHVARRLGQSGRMQRQPQQHSRL